ncbi:MAG: PAS domain S-box protein [Deltaproteobacteria bacterium]|nr:PAS domain S-box protein [Deltaproteobacteria bacterium]
MGEKPTYEDLEKKVQDLERKLSAFHKTDVDFLKGESRYRNILETIEEGYYEADLAGSFYFFNDSLCRIFGRSPDEMMGLNNRAYTTPETAKRVFSIFNEIYRTGVGATIIDYEVLRQDGTVIIIEVSASLMKNSSGKPIGFRGIVRDRTEQKKAEEAMLSSEARYRQILETIEEAYWESDFIGKLTFFNDALLKITGSTRDTLLNLDPRNIESPREAKRMSGIFAKVYQTGIPIEVPDYEVIRQDGSRMILEMSVCLLKNAAAEPVGFYGISRDRTNQRLAERALRESEAKYRHILESIEEGYFELDLKGNRTYSNNALCKLYGYTPEEMVGMNYRDYSDPETAKILFEKYNEVYKTGIPSTILDHELKRKDGSLLLVESSVYLMKDESGKPIGFHGMVRDRTQQIMAERALQQSEEKYRLLVENAHDCIYVVNDGVITFSNCRTEEFTGYSTDELSSMPFASLIHPRDRKEIVERQQKKKKSGKQRDTYSFRLLNRNDETLWVELTTIDIVWEGKPATLNFLKDITPQKKAETQLIQAQKMEAMGTLAGGIAHDFNNLLMTIQGNASLLLLDIGADHSHYGRLKNIEHQVQRGAELTKQLLGTARGGKYEVNPTNVNQLIEDGLELFGRTNKDILIHKIFQEGIWTVEVDQSQIEQVLLNIYVNAGHAMPGGGDLYVETKNVRLDENYVEPYGIAAGEFVKISVTDTGTGMDEATQKRAFDPFFTTKEMGRGTGLGLASAYGIIKNHNGIINIYSEKGEGTILNIYLPVSGSTVKKEAAFSVRPLSGTETILFADDQVEIVEIGRALLESLGYRVITAASGKDALDIYRRDRDRIDLVILDMIMPEMGGGETFDRLKQIHPHVKVLLSSGYSINGQAKTIMDRGCKGFIQKPFNLADLSKKVRQVLDEK